MAHPLGITERMPRSRTVELADNSETLVIALQLHVALQLRIPTLTDRHMNCFLSLC